jgi:hypothetical protein
MRVEKIQQYATAMLRFRQFENGDPSSERQDLCNLLLKLEDEMTMEERKTAIEMSSTFSPRPEN